MTLLFRTATPFIDLPAEVELTIVIAGPNSQSIEEGIASFQTTLEGEGSYYIIANGVLSPDEFAQNPDGLSTAFTLLIETGARETAEDGQSVDLKVLHGTTDAPNVGVNANGSSLILGFFLYGLYRVSYSASRCLSIWYYPGWRT